MRNYNSKNRYWLPTKRGTMKIEVVLEGITYPQTAAIPLTSKIQVGNKRSGLSNDVLKILLYQGAAK